MHPFGKYIRSKRIEAGKSLREVADLLGVTHVYLGEVERGARGPMQPKHFPALVAAVPGLTVADLERLAEDSKPIQMDLGDVSPPVRELGLALARKIRDNEINDPLADELLRILSGGQSK